MVKLQVGPLELGHIVCFSFKHEFKGKVTDLKTQGDVVNPENEK